MAIDRKLAGHKGHCTLLKLKVQDVFQESDTDLGKLKICKTEKQISVISDSYDTKINDTAVQKEAAELMRTSKV